ncbi:MAG: hypothetical protein UR61_C0020G0007 [candidate division WS6 bacterium GW2011_GWE1_34_7]|uniref:Nudix hydrolase domain-containing protein n=1 Tax=candidate division WS6 bacterium GW2011_GWE1_34_7 TaxID=1619093 RepID=A0A0G0B7Z3_9BACT|nr:MAG: hypothetical protein UR61_C0020G0007 [candidate division WS6 bacterium GW2011_GWE1_34_7]
MRYIIGMNTSKFNSYTMDTTDVLAQTIFVPEQNFDLKLVSTPLVFPFLEEKVMLTLDKTGFWNPLGGHMKKGETIEKTLLRESLEEAGVEIGNIEYIGYIEFTTLEFRSEKSKNYPKKSHLPIAIADIVNLLQNWTPLETQERKIMSTKDALQKLKIRTDNNQMFDIFMFILKNLKK